MTGKRWQDWVNVVLGLWLFVSPFALGYSDHPQASWNAYVLGAVIVMFAALAVYVPEAWQEMFNSAFGIWLVISPYLLGFAAQTVPAFHTVVVGVLVTAFAVGALFSDENFYKRWHDSHMF